MHYKALKKKNLRYTKLEALCSKKKNPKAEVIRSISKTQREMHQIPGLWHVRRYLAHLSTLGADKTSINLNHLTAQMRHKGQLCL